MSLKSDIVQLLQEYKDATECLFSTFQPHSTFISSSSSSSSPSPSPSPASVSASASMHRHAPLGITGARAKAKTDRCGNVYECLLHIADCESRLRGKLEDLRRHQAAQVQIQSLSMMNEQLSLIMEGVLEDMLDMKDKAYRSLDTVHSISRPIAISLEDLLEYSAQLTLTSAPPSHWHPEADILTTFRYAAPEISVEMQNSILWRQGELVGVSEERADGKMDLEQEEEVRSGSGGDENEREVDDGLTARQNIGRVENTDEEREIDDDSDPGFDEGDDDF
eukprot:TRINITY_DN240_c0_g1_i1.p1 TRINITY_DN240_c0_g1~~TRINITY_DN240_c0_g1_i1.p1  ORF type:complete len:279 (-),score=85.06 TRINITY_DN240_c0_g1_i1:126-962(-)